MQKTDEGLKKVYFSRLKEIQLVLHKNEMHCRHGVIPHESDPSERGMCMSAQIQEGNRTLVLTKYGEYIHLKGMEAMGSRYNKLACANKIRIKHESTALTQNAVISGSS